MLYETSKMVQELAKAHVRPNRGITGDALFKVESGIIAGWIKNVGQEHMLEAVPYLPSMVGQTGPEVVLGKNSGLPSVEIWLDRTGLKASEAEMTQMLEKIKEKAYDKKGLLTPDDFMAIYRQVRGA
jgi:isopropylmalate/homocitrate/citramalate synthase